MEQVIELKVLENYCIWIKFKNGSSKTINIKPFIGKGFTEELLIQENFKKVFIEPGGGIAWENGYDFCPNFLSQL
jgi:hypothetical protein